MGEHTVEESLGTSTILKETVNLTENKNIIKREKVASIRSEMEKLYEVVRR